MAQIKFYLDTTFIDTKGAGKATKYLNSGEISKREGVEIALSCLFSPLEVANEGGSISEVKAWIEQSRTQFETYMSLALSRVNNCLNSRTVEEIPHDLPDKPQKETIVGIRFDDEEL